MIAKPFTGPTLGMGFSNPPQFGAGVVYYAKEPEVLRESLTLSPKSEEEHGIAQYMIGLVRDLIGDTHGTE